MADLECWAGNWQAAERHAAQSWQVAAALFLSRRTVEDNLARVYRKLGVSSRAELGAAMTRREPTAPQS